MNDAGREKLVKAWMDKVTQIKGDYRNQYGVCAMGALGVGETDEMYEGKVCELYEIGHSSIPGSAMVKCSICGLMQDSESVLIIHLNDDHEMDFLTIARKLETA